MANLEENIQNRFFQNLMGQKNSFNDTAIATYQKLIYMRYLEVIKNSFPLFIKEVSKKRLEKSIKEFINSGSNTSFVWQMPNEYRKYVKSNKLFHDKKYLYELLYYDWIEIEIYMKEYNFQKAKKFSYDTCYTLSKSARVKFLKYDIIGNEYKVKRDNYLVIYYDFNTHDVVYREINQLLYVILKKINKKQTLAEAIKNICEVNDIVFKEAKEVLKDSLKELFYHRVIL